MWYKEPVNLKLQTLLSNIEEIDDCHSDYDHVEMLKDQPEIIEHKVEHFY